MIVRCLRLLKKILMFTVFLLMVSMTIQEMTGTEMVIPGMFSETPRSQVGRRGPPRGSRVHHRAVQPMVPVAEEPDSPFGSPNVTDDVIVLEEEVVVTDTVSRIMAPRNDSVHVTESSLTSTASSTEYNPVIRDDMVTSPAVALNSTLGGNITSEQNYFVVYVTSGAADSIYIQPSSHLFRFKIHACSDAYLLFKQKVSSTDKFSYHFGFGYGANTVIWKKPPTPITREFRTPKGGRIECSRTVSLWVSRILNTFQVGFGQNVKPYMEWTDDVNPYQTTSMTLANPWPKKQAVWHLDMNSVKVLRVDTGKEYSYEQLWLTTLGHSAIVIQVRACHDVNILLSDKFAAIGNGYEVALGIRDNQLSAIRDEQYGPNVAADETEGILDCEDFRAFWLQWSMGRIQVGRGTKIGQRKILEHAKVNPPRRIKSISLSTGGGATGRWLFNMPYNQMFPL
ncbi:hypothetical protein CAPTEDRAFT_202271 [Capitella teleta]|uniref:Farnesoic acid O-methyl transferase domain-containing protein n=1 Tax=Capitella teleta TaxID=283909 RepID=R7T9L9_CAPTE|nr:hypothetical protein CAPTEDRAFT_202271 [Capitella teleta]|eukprot:ELT90394.1 hypothetical protein CAPTEDRAFT_202271 [Capitella teleta]